MCDYGCFLGPPLLTDGQFAALVLGFHAVITLIALAVAMGGQWISEWRSQ